MNSPDIIELLYRIKEVIRAIEGGDRSQSLLEEVRTDFLDMLELIKLFLISERDSYYGYFLMNMQFRANFYSKAIAGIKLNEFPPVFESNPLLLCKFSLKEIIYVVCHEVDHVVLNHPAEMVKANPNNDPGTFKLFNLAADAAVNDRINHEIVDEKHGFMSKPDGVITSMTLSQMFYLGRIREMENYAYYFNLIKAREEQGRSAASLPMNGASSMMQKQNEKSDGMSGSSPNSSGTTEKGQKDDAKKDTSESRSGHKGEEKESDKSGKEEKGLGAQEKEGEGAKDKESEGRGKEGEEKEGKEKEGEGREGEDREDEGIKRPDGDQVVTAKNCKGQFSDHEWEAGNDADDAAAAVREFVNASFDMMNEETRGLMPGHFISQVAEINKPPVLSWQKILKKYVGTITANQRKTRMRLNRRQPERFDLSGSMSDKILKIVVAIDTSGSMSDQMIGQIMNEIFAILAKRKHDITVIECDARVQRVYKARTPADVQKKVAGRGGTWFSPVIEYVNKDKYFRDALLIYFTDGYGESTIPKPRTYRNLWVVFGDVRNLSVKEPYGVVLKL